MKTPQPGALSAVIVTLGLMATAGAALSTIEAVRFWAPRGEFEAVAFQCYGTAVDIAEFRRARLNDELQDCEAEPDSRCWSEQRALRAIDDELARLKERHRFYAK